MLTPPATPDDYLFDTDDETNRIYLSLPKSLPDFFQSNLPSAWTLESYLARNADVPLFMTSLKILSTARVLPVTVQSHVKELLDFYMTDAIGKTVVRNIIAFYKTAIDIEAHSHYALKETVERRLESLEEPTPRKSQKRPCDPNPTSDKVKHRGKVKVAEVDEEQDGILNLGEFEAMVDTLDPKRFWKLKTSGRFVENILIEAARRCRAIHNIHSLIIHTADKYTQGLFSDVEWEEILATYAIVLPDLSAEVKAYMETFNCSSVQEIHQAANARLPIEEQYDHEQHWIFRWIRIAMEEWLGLYCQKSEPLKAKQGEAFYRYEVFGCINSLLRDVADLVVVHGEVTSNDTARRRNAERSLPAEGGLDRKRFGYKTDGLVQLLGITPVNLGVLEASKEFDITGNKCLFDSQKVTRELHDMLRHRLQELHVQSKRHKLALVGYVVSGPSITTVCASSPGGYIVRIRKHDRQYGMASNITQFKINLRIVKHLLQTRMILLASKNILLEMPAHWDDDESYEKSGYSTPPRRHVDLPPLHSTPTTKK